MPLTHDISKNGQESVIRYQVWIGVANKGTVKSMFNMIDMQCDLPESMFIVFC